MKALRRRPTGRPPALLTPTAAIAKYPDLTYKRLWDAQHAGLLHPYSGSRDIRSFRDFMALEGLHYPDATWSPEDREAWLLDAIEDEWPT